MTDLIKREDALLPCPFCGGDKNIICRTDYDGRDAYAVSCRYHECHGSIFTLGYGYFATKEEAIAAWNTRALPATDPAAIREAALANQTYTYIGKDMKPILARDLEDAKDAAEAKLAECEARLGKAVEALRYYADASPVARAVLAELEGKE